MGKESTCKAGDIRDTGSILGWEEPPRGGWWQPTPAFLPEEFRGERSLVGYSLKGHSVRHNRVKAETTYFYFFLPYFSHIWRTCRRNLLVKRVKALNVYTHYCIRITSAMNNWRTTQNNLSDKEMYYFTEYKVQRWDCPRANQFCSLATILIFRFFSDFYSAILS